MTKEPIYLYAYAGPYNGERKLSELLMEFNNDSIEISDEDANVSLVIGIKELLSKLGEAIIK